MEFTLGSINVNGWARKRPLIENFLSTDNVHILGIQETKMTRPLIVSGYSAHQRDRARNSGGVAILFKHGLPCKPLPLEDPVFSDNEIVGIEINSPVSGRLNFFCLYLRDSEPFPTALLEAVLSTPRSILVGDFNARHPSFGDHATNAHGTRLADLLLTLPALRLDCEEPTRGLSYLDHVIVTGDIFHLFPNSVSLGTTVTSDHMPIVTRCEILNPLNHAPFVHRYSDYRHADWPRFQRHIEDRLGEPPLDSAEDIAAAAAHVAATIRDAKDVAIPVRSINPLRRPLPPFIVSLIREKRRILREYIRTHDPNVKTAWNRLNAIVRRNIILFKEHSWIETTKKLDYRDGRKFWKKFRVLTGQKTSSRPSLNADGRIISDPAEKAAVFRLDLRSKLAVFDDPRMDAQHRIDTDARVRAILDFRPPPPPPPGDVDFFPEISEAEVAAAIARGKNSAPGPDDISRQLLKQLPATAIALLALIFNRCLFTGTFPPLWKTSNVVMIPKPGKPASDPASYRPISLISCLGKLFERLVTDRLQDFCDHHGVIPDFQHGFRARHTAQDPVFNLLSTATENFNRNQVTTALLLDSETAFDRVWHAGLIDKLHRFRFPHNVLLLIHNFLSDRTARIKTDGHFSPPFTPRAGVAQGSILSPLLFNIYVADIPPPPADVTLQLYADDIAIWTHGRDIARNAARLQSYVNRMEDWFRRWRLRPNPNKSQLISFHHPNSKRAAPPHPVVNVWLQPVHASRSAMYLGYHLDSLLHPPRSFRPLILQVRQRARLIGALRGRLDGCRPETLLHTYRTFIRPVFDYRAILTSFSLQIHLEPLLSLERRILRRCAYLDRYYPSNRVLPRCRMEPLNIRFQKLLKNYATRAITQDRSTRDVILRRAAAATRIPKKKKPHPPEVLRGLVDPALLRPP